MFNIYRKNDRIEFGNTRGTLQGGEAKLKLRSIRSSDDWDEGWKYRYKLKKHH